MSPFPVAVGVIAHGAYHDSFCTQQSALNCLIRALAAQSDFVFISHHKGHSRIDQQCFLCIGTTCLYPVRR